MHFFFRRTAISFPGDFSQASVMSVNECLTSKDIGISFNSNLHPTGSDWVPDSTE